MRSFYRIFSWSERKSLTVWNLFPSIIYYIVRTKEGIIFSMAIFGIGNYLSYSKITEFNEPLLRYVITQFCLTGRSLLSIVVLGNIIYYFFYSSNGFRPRVAELFETGSGASDLVVSRSQSNPVPPKTDEASLEKKGLILRNRSTPNLEFNQEKFIMFANERIFGQDHAIRTLSNFLYQRLYSKKVSLKPDPRPICVALLLGPTGTGKTEIVKVVNEFMFRKHKNPLALDMSNFNNDSTVWTLQGSPTGYHGSEQGGKLTRPVIEDGNVVILLDEIEKAHSDVFKIFLSIFDEGRLQEMSTNEYASFNQSLIFMTSNLAVDQFNSGQSEAEIRSILQETGRLAPELLARIQLFVVFNHISPETATLICFNLIEKTAEQYGLKIAQNTGGDIFISKILDQVDLKYGVRDLRSQVEKICSHELIELHQKGARRIILTESGFRKL